MECAYYFDFGPLCLIAKQWLLLDKPAGCLLVN